MTALSFAAAAWWVLLGVVCLVAAAVIIYGVVIGIRNHLRKNKNKTEG